MTKIFQTSQMPRGLRQHFSTGSGWRVAGSGWRVAGDRLSCLRPKTRAKPVTSAVALSISSVRTAVCYLKSSQVKKKKNLGDMFLDCLESIFVTFKPPASLITRLLSLLSIQSVWSIRHLQGTNQQNIQILDVWVYKRGCNWLGAIKGIALWSRGFSRRPLWLETGNCAWKASGTQGISPSVWNKNLNLMRVVGTV